LNQEKSGEKSIGGTKKEEREGVGRGSGWCSRKQDVHKELNPGRNGGNPGDRHLGQTKITPNAEK